MPRLEPKPRPPVPSGGLPVSPIRPDYDRYYTLDGEGKPVRCYDYTEHSIWMDSEGKGWQIKDRLPEHGVDVWTYFSGWASLQDDNPPMFRTTVSGCMNKCYYSSTWEEAESKHSRVLAKIRLVLPKRGDVA